MSNRIPPGYDKGNISTLFDKLDEKQRKKLDEAIVRRIGESVKLLGTIGFCRLMSAFFGQI
jgi:hypothetical protein